MGLTVFLGSTPVGLLAYDRTRKVVSFRFAQSYVDLPERPVLSRFFEDFELNSGIEFVGQNFKPPNFFRNCLPEGALLKLVQAQVPQDYFREYHLLERLGPDLPGNVRLVDDMLDAEVDDLVLPEKEPVPIGSTRFSLAGLQLKLSVLMEADSRITIPVSGVGGRWIAKLPSREFPGLPENEHTMLHWAHLVGIAVPEHALCNVAQIINLPPNFEPAGKAALIIKRFDREGTKRIHQEDFAQVFNLAPEQKYASDVPDDVNYESIAHVVQQVCGQTDLEELLRRYVFMLLSGNADAHVKNWSLIYPDGRRPRLSPAYDLVCTGAYPMDRSLALEICGETNPYEITVDHFAQLAQKIGAEVDATTTLVTQFARKVRAAWSGLRATREWIEPLCAPIDKHLQNVQL